MSAIAKISESAIQKWVDEKSFARGRSYFQAGAIFAARRHGATLKALCQGSRPEPYRVEVILSSKSIQEAHCSCPVGEYGRCKHVAALLLTWLHNSDEFTEVEELDRALERRTKTELIALIKQMLLRQPELEMLLEAPLPAGGKRGTDPQTYHKQAETILRYAARDYEWGAASRTAVELNPLVATGDGFAQQQDWASAAAVYQGVSAAVLDHFDKFHDEEGDLVAVVQSCVSGLGRCLDGTGQEARETVLKALFEIYRWDVDFGGCGVGDEVPNVILAHASGEERSKIAGWVRAALPPKDDRSFHTHWQRECWGGFLLELERATLDDEAFLQICRETERTEDLIDKLLALGRLDEAVAEARKVGDYALLQLAELFVRRGQALMAEGLMAERSEITEDTRVLEWLEARYAARGDWARALELALRALRRQPGLGHYQRVREFAKKLEQWPELRPKLLAELTAQRGLLTDIYVDEGEIDQALEMIRQAPSGTLWESGRLEAAARAAEKPCPEAAIEIYDQLAERLIALRGRGNYQEACRYLKKIKELYERTKKKRSWARYISELRERHRALRALREELAAAGLEAKRDG